MGELSKEQVLKNAIEEVQARTGMNKETILKSIVNDFGEPKQPGPEFLNEFLKKGATKVTMEDVFKKEK